MNLQERIRQFITYLTITPRDFEVRVGLSNGACARLNESIRRSTCDRIARAFPQLNMKWLKTGVGDMLNPATGYSGNAQVAENITQHYCNNASGIMTLFGDGTMNSGKGTADVSAWLDIIRKMQDQVLASQRIAEETQRQFAENQRQLAESQRLLAEAQRQITTFQEQLVQK